MECEEIRLLKQSEKSIVHLMREKGGSRVMVRKQLKGPHPVYQALQDYPHPCLPKLYDVRVSEDSTIVFEEYIEGKSLEAGELPEKQFRRVVRELCSVLEFLHGKGIIHRDIKPSNVLLTGEGHVCLIDFDAARMPREGAEQDTRLLGTRGFAPPEQYGFAQTDERADIYALGVTLEQFLGEAVRKPRYKRVIRKCRSLDPDKRYQSVRQVRQAFFPGDRKGLWAGAAVLLAAVVGSCVLGAYALEEAGVTENSHEEAELTVLPAPGNPHWDGERGNVVWDNVPDAGEGDEVQFDLRLYRKDTASAPEADEEGWYYQELVRVGGSVRNMEEIFWNIVPKLEENGFYYFTVAAVGDGVRFTDSPYVVSDVFAYTGEGAPQLAVPTGLAWRIFEVDNKRHYYATWDNLDDYEDKDFFNVTFYDQNGAYVMNNTWPKEAIVENGYGGIPISAHFLLSEEGSKYRFTVQVYSSRPNQFSPSPMPEPAPEEYYSPWMIYGPSK